MLLARKIVSMKTLYGEQSNKKSAARFYNQKNENLPSQRATNFKYNLQQHHFVSFYEVIIGYYPNFNAWLYFPLSLN